MKIPSEEGVGMVNSSHLSLKSITIPTTCGFPTRGELKLPFVTRGKFIIPTPLPEGIEAM